MDAPWHDIESLEAISQDAEARALCLRMAELSTGGRVNRFLEELEHDRDLDAETKACLTELATDSVFLRAVETYVRCTRILH